MPGECAYFRMVPFSSPGLFRVGGLANALGPHFGTSFDPLAGLWLAIREQTNASLGAEWITRAWGSLWDLVGEPLLH